MITPHATPSTPFNTPSYQNQVFTFISSIIGQNNIIAIPIELVKFTGDYNTAALLTQLIYWQGRGKDPDGWIYKTYAQWTDELALSKYQVNRSVKHLVKMGILQTKVARVKVGDMYGDKAVHYKLNDTVFVDLLGKHLQILDSKDPSLSKVKKLHYPKCSNSTFLPYKQKLPTETTANDAPTSPKQAPPPPVNPQQPAAAVVQNQDKEPSINDMDFDVALIFLSSLVPKELRKPSVTAKIKQSLLSGVTAEIIRGCIDYSNDHSDKASYQRYRSHLGKCLDELWGDGYNSDKQENKALQIKEFLESRRQMPNAILIQDAKNGCKASKQVLIERGII